jgi:ribosomal protein S18 acetylase RimI-like enzyme
MIALRLATVDDLPLVLPRTRALNDHEAIEISDAQLDAALRILLGDPSIGALWLIERDGAPVGYTMITFGFDLELGGRDAVLTEIYIDPAERGRGTGNAALVLVADEARARGVHALHLQVRRDNPAIRLYERHGYVATPRAVMTRRLV